MHGVVGHKYGKFFFFLARESSLRVYKSSSPSSLAFFSVKPIEVQNVLMCL